jgi:hypothetical protein
MQATSQHSGTLLRGRKGKGGNKGTNKRLYEIRGSHCSENVYFGLLGYDTI